MKKNKSRDDIITDRLELMAEMAKKRFSFLQEKKRNEDWYIRIRGEDFRAVSLNDNTPLCRYKDHGAKKMETILQHFDGVLKPLSRETWRQKKERRIQCWIIKQALLNGGDLNAVLKMNSRYDELIFCLDEVSLGDRSGHKPIRRCDILAVGIKDSVAVPVLIELKSSRSQGELIEQLDFFGKEIIKFKHQFSRLLMECINRKVDISNQIEKILIWPSNNKERKTTIQNFHSEKIDVIEYVWDYQDPNSIQFNFRPSKG